MVWQNSLKIKKKKKECITLVLVSSVLAVYSVEICTYVKFRNIQKSFKDLFIIVPNWKQDKCLLTK